MIDYRKIMLYALLFCLISNTGQSNADFKQFFTGKKIAVVAFALGITCGLLLWANKNKAQLATNKKEVILAADKSKVIKKQTKSDISDRSNLKPDQYNLQRFVDAQNENKTYNKAIAELQNGRKVSHWMWFIFPQISGLGTSPMSVRYAISSLDEARAYLKHPILGKRLIQSAQQTIAAKKELTAVDIFGAIDAQKLHSSMTLFHRADPIKPIFKKVLDRFFKGKLDATTQKKLK